MTIWPFPWRLSNLCVRCDLSSNILSTRLCPVKSQSQSQGSYPIYAAFHLYFSIVYTTGTQPLAITQVFRACFPRTLTPTHNGCIDGKAFFDLAGSLVPSIKFQDETGTACFCESELCNNQSLPRDTPI